MKLYRGYKTIPKILIPKLQEELRQLQAYYQETVGTTTNPIEIVNKIDSDKLKRLIELRRLASPQFFTDYEEVARDFAGEKGFIHVMDIDPKLAWNHYSGEQTMQRGSKQRQVSNFVFRGPELAELAQAGKMDFINIEQETELKKETTESSHGGPEGRI